MKLKGKWKKSKACPPVYESEAGLKIHVSGRVIDSGYGRIRIDLNEVYLDLFNRFLVVTGGNERRAMMALTEELFKIGEGI